MILTKTNKVRICGAGYIVPLYIINIQTGPWCIADYGEYNNNCVYTFLACRLYTLFAQTRLSRDENKVVFLKFSFNKNLINTEKYMK